MSRYLYSGYTSLVSEFEVTNLKNAFEERGDTVVIFLKRKDGTTLETVIDQSMLERVSRFTGTWYAVWHKKTRSFYARIHIGGKKAPKMIYLHRIVTDAPSDMMVDHINHDTLDNRLSNLRLVTNSENMQNRIGTVPGTKSGVRGVHWNENLQRWQACVWLNQKKHHLGYYATIKEAEDVVVEWRKRYMPFSQEAMQRNSQLHG